MRFNILHASWLQVMAGFLVGAIIFAFSVYVLWMASYYSRLFLSFDLLFQSPVILSFPEALIPLVFYAVLALPPALILAVVISWAFGRYLRRTKALNLTFCILVGIATALVSFLFVLIGMTISGGASEASAFAYYAPFPPSFVLGNLPAVKIGRLLYTKLSSRVSTG